MSASEKTKNRSSVGSSTRLAAKSVASPGRPRNSDTTAAVLQSALELAYEGGVDSATVERIAQRSGVAKTTIYRRWPHAAAIVMDAFLTEIGPFIPYSEKKTVIETFTHAVRQLERALAGARGQMLRHLLGAAQRDADLQQAFLSNWIEPRREQARLVIEGARERGEIRREVDADVLIDMIFGPVYYRLTIPYAALDDAYVATLVKQIFRGISVPGAN